MRKSLNYLATKALGGLAFGFAAALVFAVVIWVRAVAPGTVTNPTFGPLNDDVAVSTLVLLPESAISIIKESNTCSDGTNDTWITLTATGVPLNATHAIVKTICAENQLNLRKRGSAAALSTLNEACNAGDNESDSGTYVVGLTNGQFEAYNRGRDCPSRYYSIVLSGYYR